MSQFRIKGIDYVDDSLQHGLGKGSGRGRPVGSKNGQVMPGAAYMKDYKIIGQKAEGDASLPTASKNAPNQNRRVRVQSGGGTRRLLSGSSQTSRPAQRRISPIANALKNRNVGVVSAPAANVARGRNAVNQLMGENANKPLTYTTDTGNNAPIKTGNLAPIDRSKYVERPANIANTTNQSANVANTSSKPVSNSANEARVANVERRIDQNTTNAAKQETPEQKSFWDNIGGWFAQAGKDIADTAVGAWNTASGAFNDASKWVGDRLNDAGEWAQTAYNDVSNWVGARGKEFGDWVGNAANDVGRFVGDTANNVGQWVGDTANNIGRAANEFWNGREFVGVDENGQPFKGRELGFPERLANAPQVVSQWAHDNIGYPVATAANAAGQWVGNAANDVGRFVTNIPNAIQDVWEGPVVYNPQARTRTVQNPDGTTSTINYGGYERSGGLRGDIENAANAAGQWANENIINPVSNAANAAGQWVGDTANNVGRAVDYWWNGTPYNEFADPSAVGFVPGDPNANPRVGGARRDISSALAQVGNAANDARRWAENAINNGAQAVDTFVNGPRPGTPEAAPYYDTVTGQWVDPMTQNFGDRLSQFANENFVRPAAAAGQWANENIINPVATAANAAGQWANNNVIAPVSNAANAAGQWINEGIVTPVANAANQAINNERERRAREQRVETASPIAEEAVNSGVNSGMVNQLTNLYVGGQITLDEYEDRINNVMMAYGRQ